MKFSILITCYNQAKTIGETIKSALNQTFDDYEIIISDDCSTDNSREIIREFTSYKKVKFHSQLTNLKEYRNRNFLIENSSGKYVIFIDAEDLIYPHALTFLDYYTDKYPNCGQYLMQDRQSHLVYPIKLNPLNFYRFEYLSHSSVTGRDFTTMLFSRDALIEIGLLPLNIKSGDTYTQLLLGQKFDTLLISDGHTWWRNSIGNVTSKLNPQYSSKDYSHVAETLNYRVQLLGLQTCPLNSFEINLVKTNMFGSALRVVFKWFIFLRFDKVFYFYQKVNFSLGFRSLLMRPKRMYFREFDSSNPLTN